MKKTLYGIFAAAILLFGMVLAAPNCKDQDHQEKVKSTINNTNRQDALPAKVTDNQKQAMDFVEYGVDSVSRKNIQKKREEIIQEAKSAMQETENALTALDSNKQKDALSALEKATGKLEIILAREPKLALAPMDIDVTKHDVEMTLESIQKIREKTEQLFKDGEIQKARQILNTLGSELVISEANIPLATYPDALKNVSSLIDKGDNKEAKEALIQALNTVVITNHIIPLPILRAEKMLKEAESVAEKENRSSTGNESLAVLIKNARYQLKMAETLGYGDKKDYPALYEQLKGIEKKTEKGKFGKGFFADIKNSLADMRNKIFK
jgi:hypothetical protein